MLKTERVAAVQSHAVKPEELAQLGQLIDSFDANSELTKLKPLLEALARHENVLAYSEETDFTPNEAAKLIGMSRPHLMKFIKSGALVSTKVGSHYRISAVDLDDFCERRNAAKKLTATAIREDSSTVALDLDHSDLSELDGLIEE